MSGEKAAVYVRLSEEDRDKEKDFQESRSIINQKSLLFTYAEENGFQIAGVYSDEDYTGSDRNRPMFKKLIRDASLGKFSVVLCKSQSRFTREMELVEKYIHGLFPLWGVRFIGVVDRADTLIPGNKKARQINGLVNEWYLEDLSESIKSVLNDLRSKGRHIGAFAPYGYRKDEENRGQLVPDEPAAKVVRKIFLLYTQGMSKMNIARLLNREGVPTPAGYKAFQNQKWKNSQEIKSYVWHYYTVASILENPVYTGTMVQGKKKTLSYKCPKTVKTQQKDWFVVENTHKPLIDKKTWEKAQSIIRANSRPAYKTENMDPLAGKIYCGFCGKRLRKAYHCRKGIKKLYYRCATRLLGKEYCRGTSIVSEKLKKTAVEELIVICYSVLGRECMEELSLSDGSFEPEQKRLIENRIEGLESAEKKLQEIFAKAYIDKSTGVIGEQEYSAVADKLTSDKNALEKEKRSLKDRLKSFEENIDMKKIEGQRKEKCKGLFIKTLEEDEELISEVCRELIDKIVLLGHEEKSRRAVIEITWDF